MSDQQVSVTLVPLLADQSPVRTITLSHETPSVAIGRSSKREVKNRIPAKDNAWFDSRVMSRDHAELSIHLEKKTVYICDDGSTHGTWVNNVKLFSGDKIPLLSEDYLKFGASVDRYDEIYPALEVRCMIEWSDNRGQHESPGTNVEEAKPTTSTNTFCVPEDDDSDVEIVPGPTPEGVTRIHSDDSHESVARSWDTTARVGDDLSPISSSSSPHKNGDGDQDNDLPDTHRNETAKPDSTSSLQLDNVDASDLAAPNPLDQAASADSWEMKDFEWSDLEKPSKSDPVAESRVEKKNFGPSYQEVPEDAFEGWTIMKPFFMRVADVFWGECDHGPNVDFDARVIHATRRCSLSKEAYWVDDSPDFKPVKGTECAWELEPGRSDSVFNQVPGRSLKYWFVDKRKYWIINEKKEQDVTPGAWWWIVEKPASLLSEDIKSGFQSEASVDDRHKCWIVRTWSPQVVGNSWCEHPPYWAKYFPETFPLQYDDKVVDSTDGEESDSASDASSAASASQDNDHRGLASLSDSSSDVDFIPEADASEPACEYDTGSDLGSDDDPRNDSEEECIDPKVLTRDNGAVTGDIRQNEKGFPDGVVDSQSQIETGNVGAGQCPSSMVNPRTRFPQHPIPHVLLNHDRRTVGQRDLLSCAASARQFLTFESPTTPFVPYHDGPFVDGNDVSQSHPWGATSGKASLKRTASQMESEPVLSESCDSFSQDAQRVESVIPSSQRSDLGIHPHSQAADAIRSALSEGEPPRKRIKSAPRSRSKTFASHAATAVVSAVLGGLGTVALLATLPPDYFQ